MPTKQALAERAHAIEKLREMLKPGDTVHTILRHASRSGMSRSISPVIIRDGEVFDASYLAARAMGDTLDRNNGGVKMPGAGMDMGFALVYNLSSTLWPDGFDCIGYEGTDWASRCPSNDHTNREDNAHHRDGGYALRHRWL